MSFSEPGVCLNDDLDSESVGSGWNFLMSLGESITNLSNSFGGFIDETSDALVDAFAPTDDEGELYSEEDESSEVELLEVDHEQMKGRRRRTVDLNDASEALSDVRYLRGTGEALQRRGENLARLEGAVDRQSAKAREMRENATRIREAAQHGDCCGRLF